MGMSTIDSSMLKHAFLAGAKRLEEKKDWINELNVFPVPDGDTGTNMTLTIMAAAKEVSELEDPSIEQLAKAISSGSLRGARGNSGVILSQLLRGFAKEIKSCEAISTTILANAMVRGTETAYKAVMKPKEGTILTVAKAMADKGLEMASRTEDMEEFVNEVVEYGDYMLNQTPEMLPVLKQAGVVDSGGQGLMQMVKGAADGLFGRIPEVSFESALSSSREAKGAARTDIETANIRFGYCTEFIINLEKDYTDQDETELKSYLSSIGDSLVVVSDDEVVKVHVHTDHPGLAFEKGLSYGSLSRMKVDNMREEHEERVIRDSERLAREQAKGQEAGSGAPDSREEDDQPGEELSQERKKYGFIAVSSGPGLADIFKGIGADCLIEGGQTMNPSTEDMLNAIEKVNADHIFILPNNKNIILAANQAAELTEDKNVIVIPSKTVPQGITALINFMPDLEPEANLENMLQEMEHVKTAQITYAVRTTNIEGTAIEEGDVMALGDSGILAVGKSVDGVALKTLEAMLDDSCELVTIYYGSDVSETEAEAFQSQASDRYPDKEIDLQYGGQPIYYYLISAE